MIWEKNPPQNLWQWVHRVPTLLVARKSNWIFSFSLLQLNVNLWGLACKVHASLDSSASPALNSWVVPIWVMGSNLNPMQMCCSWDKKCENETFLPSLSYFFPFSLPQLSHARHLTLLDSLLSYPQYLGIWTFPNYGFSLLWDQHRRA